MKRLLVFCAVLLCLTVSVAHPGKTDENGGHRDRATGTYHYHHGYEAHQHTGGVCPYDYDDRTGESSGVPSSSSGNNSSQKASVKTKNSFWSRFMPFLVGIIFIPLLLLEAWPIILVSLYAIIAPFEWLYKKIFCKK